MHTSYKQTGRNIFSVVAGVLTSSALFMLAGLVLLLFIASKAKGHGEESDFGKYSDGIDMAAIITMFFSCSLGGFVTGKISTKNDLIHGVITAAVLIFLLTYISEFKFTNTDILNYLLIIPFTLTGTFLAIRMKKRKPL
ncbi:MAG: hypothetical protein SGI83_13380 [Bacteroidota bacterium]|nr:hypothetical protein [Bacteroidota bacterium]